MTIGIYGGSFDPIHFGHLNVARKAMAELSLDRLIVVPASTSPFKTGAAPKENPWWNRLERIRSAFSDDPRVVVDEREIRRGGVSYAIDTVREIAAENPGAKLYFIIGEDSVSRLSEWKDYDALKTLCEFKAYPRTKESSSEIRQLFEEHAVTLNADAKMAKTVSDGVLRKNGFCPCRLQKLPEFFCPCDEFKAQLADQAYSGLCHCRLYAKGR